MQRMASAHDCDVDHGEETRGDGIAHMCGYDEVLGS